jgi:hypothetical protein
MSKVLFLAPVLDRGPRRLQAMRASPALVPFALEAQHRPRPLIAVITHRSCMKQTMIGTLMNPAMPTSCSRTTKTSLGYQV